MEFHQLKGLVALAESRSFTRAAQMTHVVQSTLSQQIRSLEEELGVQLVVRTTRKVELTAAGKAAVEYAQKLLKLREELLAVEEDRLHGHVDVAAQTDLLPGLDHVAV